MDRWCAHPVIARLLRGALVPFGVTRVLLAVAGAFSISLLPLSPSAPMDFVHEGLSPFVDAFARWDAQRYVRVAMEGYAQADTASHAFFPLFPTLIAVGAALTGRTDVPGHELIGVLIANVALVAAVMALIALVRLDHDRRTASRAAWYVMVFPTTLFLSAAYAESLFLALSVGAVLGARTQRWGIAGVLGGLATLTRPFGILVVVPMAVEAWLQRRRVGRGSRSPHSWCRPRRLARSPPTSGGGWVTHWRSSTPSPAGTGA